jgi:glutathione S-transferase
LAPASYKLFFDYLTSAFVPHVLLEELGADYELVHVDTTVGAHKTPEFRKLNPNMLIPTLELSDGKTIGENGAILTMLGDLHPESGLVPRIEDADRPFFLHWLFALATTGHTTIRRYSYPQEYTTQPDAEAATREAAWSQVSRFFDVLEEAIAGDPWFMSRGFGPLDIYTVVVCIILTKGKQDEVFASRPKLGRLYRATHARESITRLWDFYRFPRD